MIRILELPEGCGLCHGLRAVWLYKPPNTDYDAHTSWDRPCPARGGRGLRSPWLTSFLARMLWGHLRIGCWGRRHVGHRRRTGRAGCRARQWRRQPLAILEGGTRDVLILSRGEVSHTFRHRLNDASQTVGIVGNLNGWTPSPWSRAWTTPPRLNEPLFSPGSTPTSSSSTANGSWTPTTTNPSNGMGGWNGGGHPNLKRQCFRALPRRQGVSSSTMRRISWCTWTTDSRFTRPFPRMRLPLVLEGFDEGRHHVRVTAQQGGISQDLWIPTNGSTPH